jgi:hypothetical protein
MYNEDVDDRCLLDDEQKRYEYENGNNKLKTLYGACQRIHGERVIDMLGKVIISSIEERLKLLDAVGLKESDSFYKESEKLMRNAFDDAMNYAIKEHFNV